MFTHIKTSKENRILVTELSHKLNLGAENIIARVALAYSLSKDRKFSVLELKDSQGKEYSKSVLFGDKYSLYLAIMCTHYGIHKTNKDIPKFFKMHIDDGLCLINKDLQCNPNLNGFDYIIDLIDWGLQNVVTDTM